MSNSIPKGGPTVPSEEEAALSDLLQHITALNQEIDVRKRYGHFCCSAHAEAALAEKRATGVGPWEGISFATAQITNS